MGKYEKLTDDLIEAVASAIEKAGYTDDGGTCNFDSCVLYLPRWNEEKTVAAIKKAGISGYKSNFYGKIRYTLSNPVWAQANRNTVQAETIEKVMKSKGYDTDMLYLMD